MVSHGVQSETVNLYEEAAPATDEAGGAAAEEGGEESAQVSNNDIRNMLLPFIRKPAPAVEEGADEGGRKRRKKKRKGADDDSSDDNEPPPPLTLDKLGPVRAHALHAHTHSTRTHSTHTHVHVRGATATWPWYAHVHGAHAWRACLVGCPVPCPNALPHGLPHAHLDVLPHRTAAGHGRPVGRARAAQDQGAGEGGVQEVVRAQDQVLVPRVSRTAAPVPGLSPVGQWHTPAPVACIQHGPSKDSSRGTSRPTTKASAILPP